MLLYFVFIFGKMRWLLNRKLDLIMQLINRTQLHARCSWKGQFILTFGFNYKQCFGLQSFRGSTETIRQLALVYY